VCRDEVGWLQSVSLGWCFFSSFSYMFSNPSMLYVEWIWVFLWGTLHSHIIYDVDQSLPHFRDHSQPACNSCVDLWTWVFYHWVSKVHYFPLMSKVNQPLDFAAIFYGCSIFILLSKGRLWKHLWKLGYTEASENKMKAKYPLSTRPSLISMPWIITTQMISFSVAYKNVNDFIHSWNRIFV